MARSLVVSKQIASVLTGWPVAELKKHQGVTLEGDGKNVRLWSGKNPLLDTIVFSRGGSFDVLTYGRLHRHDTGDTKWPPFLPRARSK